VKIVADVEVRFVVAVGVTCGRQQFLTPEAAAELIYSVSYSSHYIVGATSLRQWSGTAALLSALLLPVGLYKGS
jgi:hypothetical protein